MSDLHVGTRHGQRRGLAEPRAMRTWTIVVLLLAVAGGLAEAHGRFYISPLSHASPGVMSSVSAQEAGKIVQFGEADGRWRRQPASS